MPDTVDDFLDGYQGPVEEVPVCGRPALVQEHALAEQALFDATRESGLAGPTPELRAEVARLEAEMAGSVRVFKIGALTYGPWSDLLAAHPPSDERRKLGHIVDDATFDPAALAACAVDPPMTVEQAQRMRDTIAPGEWQALMAAVWKLNGRQQHAPKSRLLYELDQLSDGYSDTPPPTGSPEAGSLADVVGQ